MLPWPDTGLVGVMFGPAPHNLPYTVQCPGTGNAGGLGMPTCRALPHYCQRAPRQHASGTLGYCGASPVPFPHCQHCPRRPGARPRAEPRLGVALPAPPGPTAIASAPALRGAAPGTPTSTAALGLSDGRVTGQGGRLSIHTAPPQDCDRTTGQREPGAWEDGPAPGHEAPALTSQACSLNRRPSCV